jgi:hypothetical protein
MHLIDLFEFILHYNERTPESFYIWCTRHNHNDVESLLQIIDGCIKGMKKKIFVSLGPSNGHNVGCDCKFYYEHLSISKISLDCISKCTNYQKPVEYADERLSIQHNTITLHTKHEQLHKYETIALTHDIFQSINYAQIDEQRTISNILISLKGDRFNIQDFNVIEIFMLELLFFKRTAFPIKIGKLLSLVPAFLQNNDGLNMITRRLWDFYNRKNSLLKYRNGVVNIMHFKQHLIKNLPDKLEDYIIQLQYRGIKCILQCLNGVCYVFDDYGKSRHIGIKSIESNFTINHNFIVECIVQSDKELLKAGGKSFSDELIIVTDIFLGDTYMASECISERLKAAAFLVRSLNLRNINNFVLANIVKPCDIESIEKAFYRSIQTVGINGASFKGLVLKNTHTQLVYSFDYSHMGMRICSSGQIKYSYTHGAPIGKFLTPKYCAYVLCEIRTPQVKVLISTSRGFRVMANLDITLYNYRESPYCVMKVGFNMIRPDANDLLIIDNILYLKCKPCISPYNMLSDVQLSIEYNKNIK